MIARRIENELLRDAKQLGDEELLLHLVRLLRDDRAVTAQLIAHLGEVDARRLYREHAHASMFEYSVAVLHMSESEAYTRIRAARLCREFPVALGMLAKGELHLSAVKLLAPVLTSENGEELLRAARFKSKRQIELMLVQRFPKADVPTVIRKLPQRGTAVVARLPCARGADLSLAPLAAPTPADEPDEPVSRSVSEATNAAQEPARVLQLEAPRAAAITPLRSERYKVQFTADQRLHDKVRQAQELLRHQVPDGDLAAVVERALDLLIAERTKARFALGRRARARSGSESLTADSRHIPHEVRRAVIARDGQRCSFVSDADKRCEQRGFLEFHHEAPYARGGEATATNVRVLCRAHNSLLAERDYGRAFMRARSGTSNRD